ncbi:uncharacterized protein LOC112568936 [Pomacea canaliculata]|uniref:uncharacterized protein LOC112568936 n=1 Tax=Pomacea canaliculata TaxID=400727 RepID=UPI000D726596|nr:uncharacterized protein LOC112568936 [Pomacea canaliculata]XP_025102297.1 uncharacterized protein LOC112568936 [Pomacea canaliculata]
MSCQLISTSKGYNIVCEFLRMASFSVYFHPQNGSQTQVVNCLLFNETECFNGVGFVYEKTVSSAAYISIPDTFERTPGKFVCQTEDSSAGNTTSCVWPPKNTEVPENVFTEEASLTSTDRILFIAGIVTGALLLLGLLVFLRRKNRTQIFEMISRIKKLALRLCSMCFHTQSSREITPKSIPLRETPSSSSNPLLQESVDNKKDSTCEYFTSEEV